MTRIPSPASIYSQYYLFINCHYLSIHIHITILAQLRCLSLHLCWPRFESPLRPELCVWIGFSVPTWVFPFWISLHLILRILIISFCFSIHPVIFASCAVGWPCNKINKHQIIKNRNKSKWWLLFEYLTASLLVPNLISNGNKSVELLVVNLGGMTLALGPFIRIGLVFNPVAIFTSTPLTS